MRFCVLTIQIFFICFASNAQENLFYKGSKINYCKVDSDFVAIMQSPVTNREYIIYLQWMHGVFGPTFPEFFYKSIPGLNIDSLKARIGERYGDCELNLILESCETFVKDYIFNPRYLDYPVVGVSWQNANNYGKWLADRYNENKLINEGFLDLVPTPTEQDYFNTDAYIAGFWQGQVRRKLASNNESNPERNFEWSDNVFIPVFRLPTKEEITIGNKVTSTQECFKAYPFSKKHFLYKWHKQYFASESDSVMELWAQKEQNPTPQKIRCNKINKIKITGELNLDLNNGKNEKSIEALYKQNQQKRVNVEVDIKNKRVDGYYSYSDYSGQESPFPYVILGEDKNKNPIYVTGYKDIEPANTKEFKIFRLACSATAAQLGVKTK